MASTPPVAAARDLGGRREIESQAAIAALRRAAHAVGRARRRAGAKRQRRPSQAMRETVAKPLSPFRQSHMWRGGVNLW